MHLTTSLDSSATAPSVFQRPHLVLHFDINETLLVGDEAGGDSKEDCLNKILAKSAFVRCPREQQDEPNGMESFEPTHWWNGQPIVNDATDNISPPDLYTNWEWPPDCCPYYRTAFKKYSKTFTQHHGSVYQPIYESIRDIMAPRNDAFSLIIPSFFHTLQQLSQSYGSNWTLVLRTMGTDLANIADAIAQFAQGKHPDYPAFADERLAKSRLLKGRWVLDDRGTKGCSPDDDIVSGPFTYQLQDGETTIAKGDTEVLRVLHDPEYAVYGIQDDYPHWSRHNNEPWAGKPVWIPKSDDAPRLHVLFDDNM